MWKKLLGFGAVSVGIGAVVANSGPTDSVSVVRVVDGDTFVASAGGEEKRIRLLNVDTPELANEDQPADCLAEEAKTYLATLLTPGLEVDLQHDIEETDRYGRELAGVYVDGVLINAEIAREGYGVAVEFSPNKRFYPEVKSAEQEARSSHVGIHSDTADCSLEAETETVAAQAVALAAVSIASMDAVEINLHRGKVISLLSEAKHLKSLASSPSEFERSAYTGYDNVNKGLDQSIKKLESERDKADKRIEQIEEESRKIDAPEELSRDASESRTESEMRTPELDSRFNPELTPVPAPDPVPAPVPAPAPAPAPSPGYDGYTGCRAYGGNYVPNAIDEKGRPYSKIDCTTKVQIG